MRAIGLLAAVGLFNILAWIAAATIFRGQPATLGVAILIYTLGLRHAIDADHIAAIDNVTRKLLQAGERPVAVGFFFALGHSAVVTIVAAAVGYAATILISLQSVQGVAGGISTAASALFLLAIAFINIAIFRSVWHTYRHVRAGGSFDEADLDLLLGGRGLMSRLLRPLFRLITKSWHMLPLGFLFGLGFDTATEVTMFSLSASQAAHGTTFIALLLLPALFAAGMSLIDTLDGVVMLGAYEWAVLQPIRRLKYNLVITLVSAALALVTGGIELIGFCCEHLGLSGNLWLRVAALKESFNSLGMAVVAVFLLAWGMSYLWSKHVRIAR
ncbi:HoxN/HupN/NixA family nickel/cobalt transporter [Polymorphobacter sp. PAMC 29334]|uniref:HoxN/HupN/NixA family nickel/cobalt transporter n=1 Tax=Polymorphobacter sp. PAMC 29334 TaxID=2862331 RepID=UPI001D01F404|nr:HoxN/HupN/NixA family nickel/cobalt transporter [Polymorphobacter sp. PAMC 29334]